MSKTDKLIAKLKNGTIDANELRTLFRRMGVQHRGTKGSHESYSFQGRHLTLATHSKDLKLYQIKDALQFLGV